MSKYQYPNKPKNKNGYTDEWILAYMRSEATPYQISKFKKATEGKTLKDRKNIFYTMFIEKKDAFAENLESIRKEKKDTKQAEQAKEE